MSPSERVGYRVRARPGQGLPSKLNNCQEQASQRNGAFPDTKGTVALPAGAQDRWRPGRGGRGGGVLKEVEIGAVLLW